MNERTSLGLDENIEGALVYVLGFLTGFVFAVLEKDNKFVKFHAIQSIVVFGPLFIIGMFISVLSTMPYMYWMFSMVNMLLWIVEICLWLLLIMKAYQHEMFKVPIAGDFAESIANK